MGEQANANPYPTGLKGWLYYCGRMHGGSQGGLQLMKGNQIVREKAAKTQPSGDVIGMAIDCDECSIVFDLNGTYQGGGRIPKEPMWIITTVDRPDDQIEVRKVPLSEIPQESIEHLQL